MGRGRGAVFKPMRAGGFEFTVTRAEDVTPEHRRPHFSGDGGLATTGVAPGPVPSHVLAVGAPGGLPCRADPRRHEMRVVPRRDSGVHPAERVRAGLPEPLRAGPDPYVRIAQIACGTATPRTLSAFVRKEPGAPRRRMRALGYRREPIADA